MAREMLVVMRNHPPRRFMKIRLHRSAMAVVVGLALITAGLLPIYADQTPSPPAAPQLQQAATWGLQPQSAILQVGETQQFSGAVVEPFARNVVWAATGGDISDTGVFRAPQFPGKYQVTATLGGSLVAHANVTVTAAQGTTTVAAARFVDSVGVNVHLHYNNTIYYQNFPLVKQRLMELGVRHVRDGMIDTTWQGYNERHNELGRAGIKGLFIVPALPSERLLREYPIRMSSSFEAYEAPNEYNTSKDPNWVNTLRETLSRLRALESVPALAGFPIYGPSLTRDSAYAALGDVSGDIDAANMHNYFAGREPGTSGWGSNGYGSIAWNLRMLKAQSVEKPIVTTETGYANHPGLTDSVPEDVAGKYMPRMLLEQFRHGITRTYIYELADEEARKQNFGLLTKDGEPKPAFRAVANLLNLLHDTDPAFAPIPLAYSLSGGSSNMHQMVFQKEDGGYYLAFWIESAGYDVVNRRYVSVPSQTVQLSLPNRLRVVTTHTWQSDGRLASVPTAGAPVTFVATDTLQILEIRP